MVRIELRYVGRFSDTEIDGIGYVRRRGTIFVPEKIAEGLLKRKPLEWELAAKKVEETKEIVKGGEERKNVRLRKG